MNEIKDKSRYQTLWTIRKYANDADYAAGRPFETARIDGNVMLNEGIGEHIDLLCGIGGTAFSNANAYIGVGDSDTAAAASQTALQAETNKLFKAMESGYPQRSNQTVTFRSVYGSADANYAWKEFTVSNSNSDAGKNLNRKVSDQGTKASGQTWTVDLSITFS
ncbi:MAG TPA: hypothetical protein VLL97_00025 [Acidobacteriota bacterium]|nr:hypothetical protein [Acidobacteriota bacterium]